MAGTVHTPHDDGSPEDHRAVEAAESRAIRPELLDSGVSPQWDAIIEDYLNFLQFTKGRSSNTIKAYRNDLHSLVAVRQW